VQLTYEIGQPFSAHTLQVRSLDNQTSWQYGQTNANANNLLGTIKSLDELDVISLNCSMIANVSIHDESLHCEWALFSTDGWAIIDDSTNYALDSTYWWDGVNTDSVDTYLFVHGLDFKGAIFDYTLIGGKISMVPRYGEILCSNLIAPLLTKQIRSLWNLVESLVRRE